jgi:putative hemin transport protein
MIQINTLHQPSLREQLRELRAAQPHMHMRDLARELHSSEGALIASGCGAEAKRLDPRWTEFLPELPSLGEVMVLTRNEGFVHEKDGAFAHVGFIGTTMAQVVNHDVDLRIFLRSWKHLFAVEQLSHGRTLSSFQVFDGAGRAVHKIYLREHSHRVAYQQLVDRFASADQSTDFVADEIKPVAAPNASADQAALHARWSVMKDTHDFYPMIRDLGLTRREANALVGEEFARRLPPTVLESLLRRAAEQQVPIMVFVGNPGCIQIHTGPVHRIERMGQWLNVLDPGFNLHIRTELVADAWLVRKPTVDGIVTSIEFFDAQGGELALFFGERKPGKLELESWRELVKSITTESTKE